MEDTDQELILNRSNIKRHLGNKRFFLLLFFPFILLIINYWNETFIVSLIMQYKNYEGIGILGLNFTLNGGDLFFFFYNFLIITLIIMVYCFKGVFQRYNAQEIKKFQLNDKKLRNYSQIALKLVIILSINEIFVITLRFLSFLFYVDAGLLILHFILDLVFNITIIISFASYFLTKIKLDFIKNI